MTKFEVYIPKDKEIYTFPDNGPWAQTGYLLSIYCGFDALRLLDREQNQAKTCQLYIHSRQCGRLIEVIQDARDLLGLKRTGTEYCQGLTLIIDDVSGELPLKPTKDGLTWSKDMQFGETHRTNLFAWAGGVAGMYWLYHTTPFRKLWGNEFKSALSKTILNFVEPIEKRLTQYEENPMIDSEDESLERVEKAKFCMFSDVPWKKIQNPNTKKLKIHKVPKCKLELWREDTPATVWKINESHYPPLPPAEGELATMTPTPNSRKGRRTSASGSASAASAASTSKKRRASSLPMIQSPVPSANPLAMISPTALHHTPSNQIDSFNNPQLPRVVAHSHQSPTRWQDVDHLNIKRLEDALDIKTNQVQQLHCHLQQARLQLMTPPQSASEQNSILVLNQLRMQNSQLQQQILRLQHNLHEMQLAKQSVEVATQETHLLQQQKQQLEQQVVTAEQSLQVASEATAKLKQQTSQVEHSIQECQGSHNAELKKMELEMETLTRELAKRKRTIEQLRGGNGFVWGQGTDEI